MKGTLKKTVGDAKRRRCRLCGEITRGKALRWSPASHNQLAVMLSSQVIFGGVDVKRAKLSFEACVPIRKRFCHRHFSEAAKYLLAELTSIGISLSYDALTPTAATYVTEKDIPNNFVNRLNDVVKQFDHVRFVTAKDIMKYINKSAWQYYTGTGSDSRLELLPATRGNRLDEDETQSGEPMPEAPCSNGIKQEEESESTDYGVPLSELIGPSCSSNSAIKEDSISKNANLALISPPDLNLPLILPPDLDPPLPTLRKTDPKLLQYSFMVDGKALLKLFQFCPQCGQELEADGAVRLLMDGAEPVVQYVCGRCSREDPVIKTWKAQED